MADEEFEWKHEWVRHEGKWVRVPKPLNTAAPYIRFKDAPAPVVSSRDTGETEGEG